MKRALLPRDVVTIKQKPREQQPSFLPMLYRNGRFYKVDGRSREGILLRDTSNALLEQLEKPTPAEKLLVQRLSWLHLCISTLDRRVLSGNVSFNESLQYSSHIDSFSRGLVNFGLLGPVALPTLNDTERHSEVSTQNASDARSARRRVREVMRVDE